MRGGASLGLCAGQVGGRLSGAARRAGRTHSLCGCFCRLTAISRSPLWLCLPPLLFSPSGPVLLPFLPPLSGVSLDSFQKKMTVQALTYEGLQNLGPAVAKMAEVEGLDAHRRAVTLRLGIQ